MGGLQHNGPIVRLCLGCPRMVEPDPRTSVDSIHGYPTAPSLYDWTLSQACESHNIRYSLSDELRHHLIIQRVCHRISQAMSGNGADPLGLPADDERQTLMAGFEGEIDEVEAQHGERLSGEAWVELKQSISMLMNSSEKPAASLVHAPLSPRLSLLQVEPHGGSEGWNTTGVCSSQQLRLEDQRGRHFL